MTSTNPTKRIMLTLAFFFVTIISYGQLNDFNLTVTPTPQTCLGNGVLTFSTSGTTAGSSIDYSVYLLPNTTTPISVTTGTSVTGLAAGSYMVIATQTLGANSNTATANTTIVNQVVPLAYTLQQTKARCGSDGKITVLVSSGVPVSYEILSGPVTVAQQASNVFNNLPSGLYSVRVYDNCGEAVVVTIQVQQDTTGITFFPASFAGGELPACNQINIVNTYVLGSGATNIFWPLTFSYTVYPPGGGAPVIVSQNVSVGSLSAPNNVVQAIPFYAGQQYSYNLQVTDACGNVYSQNNNEVNQSLSLFEDVTFNGCNERFFELVPNNFMYPVTVTFNSAPAGFVPGNFSTSHPVFNDDIVYQSGTTPVPLGEYDVTITDGCGRTANYSFEIELPDVQPQATSQAECGDTTGFMEVFLTGSSIATITVESAPPGFGATPIDMSAEIVDGTLVLNDVPLGSYSFSMVDICGDPYTLDAELDVDSGNMNVSVIQRPGCEEGFGSIRLNAEPDFASVSVTVGPPAFSSSYPVDVTANIAANGDFYMNSLPAGNYEFSTFDECGIERIKQVNVTGYTILTSTLNVIPYCGSFQLDLVHNSNGNYVQSFWLQRYNEATGTWGHPETNVPYVSGIPVNANSIYININDNTPFYFAVGDFRIIKTFYTYGNGVSSNNMCFSVLHEFTFTGGPVITEVFSFPCADALTEVAVQVEGVPPFTYKITTKDNQPFEIDNGSSNIFSGLEAAYYNFQVTDACGNIVNSQFNINATDPLVITPSGFCEGEDSFLSVQPLSFLNYQWYEASNPGTVLSTTNSLDFTAFNSATDSGTYMVNITTDNPVSCMNTTLTYEVQPNQLPNAGEDNASVLCNDGSVLNLFDYIVTPHDNNGTWMDTDATGALTDNMLDAASLSPGTYNFTYVVTGLCSSQDESVITLTLNEAPATPVVDAVAPVCEGSAVQLSLTEVAGVTYQWSGPNGFTSTEANPLIADAGVNASGTYSVTATAFGCTSQAATVTVVVNSLPVFTISGNSAICEGQSTILTVSADNFDVTNATFAWYKDGAEISGVTTPSVEVFETGAYEVTATLNGCSSTQAITISQNSTGFDVVLEDGCVDFQYTLTISNIDVMAGSSFVWTGPDGYYYVGEEAVITNMASGEYSVLVTNAEGCSVTGSVMVENTSCMIPRGISPNDDEYNQSFDLSNLDVTDLQIFNRYGLQVYAQENYTNQWYGQSDKGELPTGTYFYVLTLAQGKKMTGWVYLQRQVK